METTIKIDEEELLKSLKKDLEMMSDEEFDELFGDVFESIPSKLDSIEFYKEISNGNPLYFDIVSSYDGTNTKTVCVYQIVPGEHISLIDLIPPKKDLRKELSDIKEFGCLPFGATRNVIINSNLDVLVDKVDDDLDVILNLI